MADLDERIGAQSPDSSSRRPSQRRASTPKSQRLSTINEGANAISGTQQPKGILRTTWSPHPPSSPDNLQFNLEGARYSRETTRTGPPAYEWVPEPIPGKEDEAGRAPVEGEKLAQVRRGRYHGERTRARGGWGRLWLILGMLLLIAIALGVGLGIGLTRRKPKTTNQSSSSTQPAGTTPNTGQIQAFPLGEYSLITALRAVDTNCTSNPVTWECYPYTVFNASDSSTNTSSLASFNWIISNTSSTYATNTTATTSAQGVPANLTISSTADPFSISFSSEPMTYISSSGNSSSARYIFSFTMQKAVIPGSSITSDNAAAECFFNQTTFTASLYLEAPSSFPSASLANATGLGGYTPWPYAVEITQSSPGGQNVPACYETVNGAVGNQTITGLTPESSSSTCLCDWRNY